MNIRNTPPALLLMGLLVLQSTNSHGQEAIGSATSVKPQAEANARTLSGGVRFIPKNLFTLVTELSPNLGDERGQAAAA
jgi:hypothetical protein